VATGEEEEEAKAEVVAPVSENTAPISAVIRIRIPKKQPEIEKDEDGNEIV